MNIANNLVVAMSKVMGGVNKLSGSGDKRAQAVSDDVNTILKNWVGPIMICLGAVGAIYMVILGVQYAKSESDSKRAEAKSRMINCLIGVIAIIVLAALCIGMDWAGLAKIFGYTQA